MAFALLVPSSAVSSAVVLVAAAPPMGVGSATVAITLVAAVLHAVWNAIAHGISDRLLGFALIGLGYTVVSGIAVLPPALLGSSLSAPPRAVGPRP